MADNALKAPAWLMDMVRLLPIKLAWAEPVTSAAAARAANVANIFVIVFPLFSVMRPSLKRSRLSQHQPAMPINLNTPETMIGPAQQPQCARNGIDGPCARGMRPPECASNGLARDC